MFRYKANLASKTLSEEHSKITRLSSGESYTSKDGVDPGKDSWVFSKETPSTKIHRDPRRKSEQPDTRDTRIEEEAFSLQTRDTPIDENMKVNVLYRGMVYRIRGIKIICSILAGIILLLAAIVILGIWIILGASDDGKFYFPWSKSPANESSVGLLPEMESNLANLTKIGGFLLSVDTEEQMPSIADSGGEMSYRMPSEEVGEALGHLQAANPTPGKVENLDNQVSAATESHLIPHDEYYYEYDEDYKGDGDMEYSLNHPTIVEAPSNFFQKLPKNYKDDETILPESYENDFRVHLGESKSENGKINVPHLVKPSDLTTTEVRDNDRTQSFRPSPRIPERSPLPQSADTERDLYRNGARKIEGRHPNVQEFVSDEGLESFSQRPFTNAHITRDSLTQRSNTDERLKQETDEISNEYDNVNDDDYYKDTTVVQYDDILIAKNPQDEPIYFEQADSIQPERKAALSRDYSTLERDALQNDGRVVRPLEAARPALPTTLVKLTDDDEYDEDPHRSLFVGKYDSSQVILDEDSLKSSYSMEMRNRGPIDERRPLLGHQNRRIESRERTRFSVHPKTSIPTYHYEGNRPPFFPEPLNSHLRAPPVSRRPVPGTVHPIPNIRRSHISAGYRPRIGESNYKEIRLRDRQNSQLASQAEQFADSIIAESITYPSVVRVDGSPVNRRGPMPFYAMNPNRMGDMRPSDESSPQKRISSFDNKNPLYFEQEKESGFLGALQKMYDYSSQIASSLMNFPAKSDLNMTNSTTDFLKNSFGLLSNYDNIFQNLPQVFMQPLKQFRLPSVDQLDKLNPFELSLMTWTFIDFWEFLIEKVGTLSKEDLRVLEMRLEKIREQKDNSMARAFIDSIPISNNDTDNDDIGTAVKTFKLSLLNVDNSSTALKDSVFPSGQDSYQASAVDTAGAPDTLTEGGSPRTSNARGARRDSTHNWADPLQLFSSEQRSEFMQYTIKTLLNFGKVYLRSDYALDCMMLLFCKDINAKTKHGGMDGIAARLKSVGLKVLVDREGRETDTVSGVWQALTKWEPLHCDSMFPKCDGSKALEIVNEVANASRR